MPRVNREQLLSTLQSCLPGLATKPIIEQSTCFCFMNGKIYCYNDETACCVDSPLGDKFTGAVEAQPLLDLLGKMQEEEIEIEAGDGEMLIRGKGRRAGIRMEAEVLLPIQVIEKPEHWQKLHDDFCEAIGMVEKCAGKDENKFSLTCIHVHPNYIEAFDNYQLCRWKLDTGFKQESLMRKNGIKDIVGTGATEFAETKNWVHFRNARGQVLSCRRYADVSDYPSLTKHFEEKGEPLTLPKSLKEAIEKAQTLAAKEGEEGSQVSVELKPERLLLGSKSIKGWYQENKKVSYTGKPIAFFIPPEVLKDMVSKHSECSVTENRLIVNRETYTYISCVTPPANGNGKHPQDEVREVE